MKDVVRKPASDRQKANQTQLTGQLGAAIKRLRLERGWTTSELGEKAGVDKAMVKFWESGTSAPAMNRLPAVASVFGLKTSELVRLAEDGVAAGEKELG